MILEDQWFGLYSASLNGIIVKAAYAHPAKYSWNLINRIYAHIIEEGWVTPGQDVVLDPMCGVGVGLIAAANAGLKAIGIELEPHFVAMAQCNKDLHTPTWLALGKPIPVVLHGDARNLLALVREAGLVVSSPPYAQSVHDGNGIDHTKFSGKQAGRHSQASAEGYSTPSTVVSSPPYAETTASDWHLTSSPERFQKMYANYKKHGGGMSEEKFRKHCEKRQPGYSSPQAVISSPPYADGCAHTGGADAHPEHIEGGHTGHVLTSYSEPAAIVSSPPFGEQQRGAGLALPGVHTFDGGLADNCGYQWQGKTPGQLGALPMGDVQAVISSPPFVAITQCDDPKYREAAPGHGPRHAEYGESEGQIGKLRTGDVSAVVSSPPWEKGAEGILRKEKFKDPVAFAEAMSRANGGHGNATPAAYLAQMGRDSSKTYGVSQGQIGNQQRVTYWESMRDVYAACHELLPVGGHMCLVLKGFIRKRKYVDLPGQTAQLLEHLGFTVLHMHRAMLTAQVGQLLLDGGEERKSRKSFFRRLAEKSGAPAIDFEVVVCAVKK